MNPDVSTSSSLRLANTQRVLDTMRAHPGTWMAVRVLSESTGISRPTVTRIAEHLLDQGWVEARDGISQGIGRPAREFRFKAEHQTVAGIDATPGGLTAVLANLNATELRRFTTRCDLSDPSDFARALREAVEALTQESDYPCPASIVVGIPGLVRPAGDIWTSPTAPAWIGAQVPQSLDAAFPRATIRFANDSRLAALLEMRDGELTGTEAGIYLHSGKTVNPTPIVHGRIYGGASGGACGGGDVQILPTDTREEHVLELTRRHVLGDTGATEELRAHAESLAFGIAMLASAYDPSKMVVGGPLAAAPEAVLPPLAERMQSLVLNPPELAVSSLDPATVVLDGAVRLAIELLHLESTARVGADDIETGNAHGGSPRPMPSGLLSPVQH